MRNYAIIYNDVIENVVVWDGESEYIFPEGAEVLDITDIPGAGRGCYRTESGWRNPKDDVVEEQ
jgi:hypothetical protein